MTQFRVPIVAQTPQTPNPVPLMHATIDAATKGQAVRKALHRHQGYNVGAGTREIPLHEQFARAMAMAPRKPPPIARRNADDPPAWLTCEHVERVGAPLTRFGGW